MDPSNDLAAALVLLAIALAIGALGARVFAGAGLPGGRRAAALVGGIVVGLLAGTGGLSVFWPDTFDAWTVGGTTERKALIDFDAQTDAHVAAIQLTGVTDVAIDEHLTQRATERAPLEDALFEALVARSDALSTATHITLGLFIAAAAPFWLPRERAEGGRDTLGLFVGVILATALGMTLLRTLAPTVPDWAVMTVACVVACLASAPSARAAGPLAGWSVLGLFVCISLARMLGELTAVDRQGVSSLTVALGVATMLLVGGWLPFHMQRRATQRRARRALGTLAHTVLLPAIVALTVLRIDASLLWGDWVFWTVLVASSMVSSDLRWYALARVMRTAGREDHLTAAERCANAGGGIAQLIVALALHHVGAINESLLLALLIGAAVGEMTVRFRARMARAMQRGDSLSEIFEEDQQP